MKDWLKKNWKTYLLLILSALFGADKVAEFTGATGKESFTVASGLETDGPAWVITARLEVLKTYGGGPFPAITVSDKAGVHTLIIPGLKRPSPDQIVRAAGYDTEEGQWKVEVVSEKRPPKWESEQGPEEE